MVIAGIVLAAGASRRMGTTKSLLELEGRTFLQHSIEALSAGGCDPVFAVLGSGTGHGRAAHLARSIGARVIRNEEAGSEQIDSLRLGLRGLPSEVEGVVVHPVDVPEVGADLVSALIASFRGGQAPLVLPEHEGRHGHPVLFSRFLFTELLDSELPEGARSVVHAHLERAITVPVARLPGDVDTPGDLQRLMGRP